jgi:hypothetical protein
VEAGHEVEEGRLAGAVRPDEAGDGAGADLKRAAVDGPDAAERLAQALDGEERAQTVAADAAAAGAPGPSSRPSS